MSIDNTIQRGRAFSHPVERTAADETTPVDWPDGEYAAELRATRDSSSTLLATFTVDDTARDAANGARLVLRLTEAQADAIPAAHSVGYADLPRWDGTQWLPSDVSMKFAISPAPTVTDGDPSP